ncbi:MAG TPA: hypothetical protein VI814_00115, partial [Candidatus Limnocylindria bacterium]
MTPPHTAATLRTTDIPDLPVSAARGSADTGFIASRNLLGVVQKSPPTLDSLVERMAALQKALVRKRVTVAVAES